MLQVASLISRANRARWNVSQAIQRIVQPLDLSSVSRTRPCVLRGLGQRLNKQKTIRSTKAEWMVFRICTYRCIACDYLFVGMLAIVFYILVCYDINNVVYRIVYNEEDVTWQL